MIVPLIKGLWLTLTKCFSKPITVQYPEEKIPPAPRWRGYQFFEADEQGRTKCVGCGLCMVVCPSQCITVETAEDEQGRRYPSRYEIDTTRCIFCGYCEDACPTNAIVLEPIEFPTGYTRESLIYTKSMLLESPPINVPATPQRTPPGKYDRAILPFPPIDESQ